MKHKYYYNNQLVRTSANEYKYAVITGKGNVLSCSRTYELAVKSMSLDTSETRHNLNFYKALLDAIQLNKKEFWYKNKRLNTEEYMKKQERYMEWHNDDYKTNYANVIDYIKEVGINEREQWLSQIKIVELEQR